MKFQKAARPVIMGQNGMVSSGHYLASLAGVEILKEGGNAVDAALAAAFVSAVVKPETSGPGGDLFALVSMKQSGKVEALNASGPAPAQASIEAFHKRGLKTIPQYGPLAIAVPGAVDGWLELHKKYGTVDLARLTADAVRLGREGFPISQEFSEAVHEFAPEYPWVDKYYRQPFGAAKPGKILVQSGYFDLACPYGTVKAAIDHLNITPDLRRNVNIEYYEAGHMMYVHPGSMGKFSATTRAFIDANSN